MGDGLESFQNSELLLKVYPCASCHFRLHHHVTDLASAVKTGLAAGRLRPAVELLFPGQAHLLHRGALARRGRPVGAGEQTQEVDHLRFQNKPI